MYTLIAVCSNPIEDHAVYLGTFPTYSDLKAALAADAETRTPLYDDVTGGPIHPDFGLVYEVTREDKDTVLTVHPAVDPQTETTDFFAYLGRDPVDY